MRTVDALMKDLAREYYSGHIGITNEGEIVGLSNTYSDISATNPPVDYHIAPTRELDREYQKQCQNPECGVYFRTNEIKDGRCPFCWVLI